MAFKKITIGLCIAFVALGAYVVEEGDTLWDISADKLGDPFAWPAVWEANPQIIDPHLIYPGNQVKIDVSQDGFNQKVYQMNDQNSNGTDQTDNINGVNYAGEYSNQNLKSDFYNKLKGLKLGDSSDYKKLNENQLTLDSIKTYQTLNINMQRLSPKLVLPFSESRTFPSEVRVYSDNKAATLLIAPKSLVIVNLGIKDNLKLGDTLDLFSTPEGYTSIGTELKQKQYHQYTYGGFAVIKEISEQSARLFVEEITGKMRLRLARAIKRTKSNSVEVMNYTPVEKTSVDKMSRIVKRYTPSKFTANFSYISVNKGLKDNYNVGDAVAIWNRDKNPNYSIPPRLIAQGIITWTGPSASTIMVLSQIDYNRNPSDGDYVSLTHRARYRILDDTIK